MSLRLQAGTTEQLTQIGVRNAAGGTARAYPNMPLVSKGWNSTGAFFKAEGNQINIGLGRGSALDLFNSNITGFNVVPR